ncbi:hypothetical protein DFQ28_006763 [Apophysomyces sp. BC1034]|nr:hypothetical protein DFQ30_004881 [Apophysomyces sp. BC1015]KAG0180072.1 hypothetical protein DFQ29_001254 [Apophysomyces sp. BC1021]KAG0193022.1 hypothetical protein DFQ28_006763 [Apophysomyces sp. BC1034]
MGDDLPSEEIVMHLVDLFFKYINSVFPLVHRATIKQGIVNGTVSKPLLWAVMAIGARFSDHPSIKTNPPYLAGERFAVKATSLIDATLMEPTMPNLQFWGIMSCLEYGRAAGSKAWVYGNLAVRFSSAGTASPQGFDIMDCDAQAPRAAECIALRDPSYHVTVDNKQVVDDSLMDIAEHYMKLLLIFGEVNKCMNRAKSDSATIVWPPIAEFSNLDAKLRGWKSDLSDRFQFTPKNLTHHKENASLNYINLWLNSHGIWCSSMMILHRGSLAFSNIQPSGMPDDVSSAIQSSINTCETCVETAMGVFRAMRDMCGFNVLPYMGYSAYIFATVLMTSTFSKGRDAYRQSSDALKVLYDLIEGLKPYWPMCERLANTTRDLLAAHSRLYELDEQSLPYNIKHESATSASFTKPVPLRQSPSSSPGFTLNHQTLPSTSQAGLSMTSLLPSDNTVAVSTGFQYPKGADAFFVSSGASSTSILAPMQQQQQPYNPMVSDVFSNSNGSCEINFNSLEFLYDSALFGQIMFDATKGPPSVSVSGSTLDFPSTIPQGFTDTGVVDTSTTFDDPRLVQRAISTRPYSTPSDKSLWNSS